jgi:hypothetical protein
MEIYKETGREVEDLPLDLRLAAIVTLLSSSALNGRTPGKAGALRHHLEAAIPAAGKACHAHLADALRQAMRDWQEVCPNSMAEARLYFRPSGQRLH